MNHLPAPSADGSDPSSDREALDREEISVMVREFREFLERLRLAKDRAEFDQFMAERRNRQTPDASQPQT